MSRSTSLLTLAAATVVAAVVMFVAGFWAGSARDGSDPTPETGQAPMPAWFGPIWDHYDRNPAVTPEFDFAALYFGEVPTRVVPFR
jgi:hypothetical protein